MKECLIQFIITCGKELHSVATNESMSPSSSVEEIATYVSESVEEKIRQMALSEMTRVLRDIIGVTIKDDIKKDGYSIIDNLETVVIKLGECGYIHYKEYVVDAMRFICDMCNVNKRQFSVLNE